MKPKQNLSMKNIFSYAVGDLYGGGAFFIIGALFLVFLTDVAKISPALAGTIILVGKVWDAVTDPTMGYISDHTKSKYGRRRLYFLIGIVPIFLSWFLLWSSFGLTSDLSKFVYYLLVYLLFNTVFTLVMVPYNSMPSEMTNQYQERSKLITIRMLFSQGGMLLGAVLPLTIVNFFSSDPSLGYMVMATIFGLIFSIPWIFVFLGTFEKKHVFEDTTKMPLPKVVKKISKDFGSTLKNKSLRIHTTMYITAYVSMDIFNALLIYFIRDYLNQYGNYQVLLGIVVIIQMLSLFIVMKLVNKVGNAMTYRIHATIWMAAVVALFLVNPNIPIWAVLIIGAFVGLGLSGCVMTPYNMLAFVVDADEMITTKRREGIYAGMMTFLRKIAQAFALFLVGVGLELVNYQQPIGETLQVQTPETLMGIRLMFLLGPVVLLILGIISSYRYKISPKNHEVLMSEISRLKDGGSKADVELGSKAIVESITGLDYELLWHKEGPKNDKKVLDGFEIYDDDHLIIKHTLHEPAIFLGDKALKIDMENGEFKFQDDTVFKPVKPFEIKGDLIDFVDFQMEIDTTDKSLFRLKFNHLNQPIKIILPSNKDESIYGMGEQFTSLNLKGHIVKNWVQEHITRKQIYHKIIRRIFKLKPKQWKFEDYKTYFIAPTFISSKNYFCHVNTLGYATFDFSNQDIHQISIYSKVSHIDFCKKPTLLELSGALSKYVGMMPKLPEWIYDGMIFAIQGGTKIINDKIDILNKNEVKINGIWSQDWCGELYTFFGKQVFWNWEVDPNLYPNLEENIKSWKKNNIHFLAYVNPYLNANGKMYQEALKLNYLVKNMDQTPFLTKATSFDFGIVDLTNEKAYEWFKDVIKNNYINIGIMGWMADFGEYLPVSCNLCSGSPEELHNHWPDLWAKLNREVLEETNMLSSALFFNRAGYKDNSRYSTLIWNGDQHVDFTDDFGMASALRAMLSLSFSGIGFSHSDIGGYTTVPAIKRSKTLYIRWLEMNTFVPIMRSHEGNKPWKNVQFDYDDQVLKLTSKFTNIHVLLKPYFLAVEKEYQAYGYPMIRPLMFHHDYFTDKAFMLGKDVLIYPVLAQRNEKQNIYIPKGHWIHLFTGERYSQKHIKIKSPLGVPAVFYNEDSKYLDVFNSIVNYLKTNH